MINIKSTMFAITLLLCTNNLFAQSISFKKGKVFVDDQECLLDKSSDANNIEISMMDGKQTIILKFIRTGIGPNGGLYTKIIFVEQNKSLTSRSFIFTKKLLVKKLLGEEVIVNCNINVDNIDKFIMKYDEKIEVNLIRH